jgi:3-oxoacyl-[acyl-carrier-protein] synthase-3
MFASIAKSIEVPIERFYITLDRYGNSSSASCAIALDEAVRDGSIKDGNHICMPVFGGGLTWGAHSLDGNLKFQISNLRLPI